MPDRPNGPQPAAGSFAESMAAALFARRILLVHGDLDARSSELAAALMTLDADGDEHVELRLSTVDGSLQAALSLIDIVDTSGVPIHTTALGVVAGGAVGVFTVGARRRMAFHAALHLRLPEVAAAGNAADIEQTLADHAWRRDRFLAVVAARTGRPLQQVAAEWDERRFLRPDEAVRLGYADRVDKVV